MTDWQDISTAPKDGSTIILGKAGKWSSVGWWEAPYEGGPDYEPFDGGFTSLTSGLDGPTHWMPLPKPPEAA